MCISFSNSFFSLWSYNYVCHVRPPSRVRPLAEPIHSKSIDSIATITSTYMIYNDDNATYELKKKNIY